MQKRHFATPPTKSLSLERYCSLEKFQLTPMFAHALRPKLLSQQQQTCIYCWIKILLNFAETNSKKVAVFQLLNQFSETASFPLFSSFSPLSAPPFSLSPSLVLRSARNLTESTGTNAGLALDQSSRQTQAVPMDVMHSLLANDRRINDLFNIIKALENSQISSDKAFSFTNRLSLWIDRCVSLS